MNKYLIKKQKDGKYTFILTASNGQVICRSNTYYTLAGVHNGIESVKKHSSTDNIEYEDQSIEKKIK